MRKRDIVRSGVVWLDRGFQPAFIGFCPNLKAWRELNKEFNVVPSSDDAYVTHAAATHIFNNTQTHEVAIVVTLADRVDHMYRTNRNVALGLIVHECTHVWQHILKNMMETDKPGDEVEAYAMQGIFMAMHRAYLNTRINKQCRNRTIVCRSKKNN